MGMEVLHFRFSRGNGILEQFTVFKIQNKTNTTVTDRVFTMEPPVENKSRIVAVLVTVPPSVVRRYLKPTIFID
jgi:hypothetical protein